MIGRGVHLGSILGIPIRIDYSWLIIVFLLTASLAVAFGQSFPYLGFPARFSLGLCASLLLFGSVLAHELSHAVVALRNRVGIRGITLFVFGGAAEMLEEPRTAGAELRIAVAGPVMSLLLALMFLAIHELSLGSLPPPFVELAAILSRMNLLLVAFNAVPGFPLDGGRVLRAMLWGIWGKLSPATRVAAAVGSFFGGLVIVLGLVWIFFYENLIGGLWFVFIGLFLRNAARGSYQQLVVRRALEGIRASDLMNREVEVVPPGISLEEAVERVILPSGASEVPVVEEGRLVGMLELASIRERRSSWGELTAADVMSREVLERAVSPQEEAVKVLGLLGSEDRLLPVVEEGRLVGVVTRRDLLRRLQIRLQLRS